MSDAIKDYLISNAEHLESLVQPHREKKDRLENNLRFFNGEIEEQYNNLKKYIIANEVTNSLAIPYEDVIVVLESINLEAYIK